MLDMLRQRVYALAAGYEDINDHQTLRENTCFQTAVSRERVLASPPTLSRFENALDRERQFHLTFIDLQERRYQILNLQSVSIKRVHGK